MEQKNHVEHWYASAVVCGERWGYSYAYGKNDKEAIAEATTLCRTLGCGNIKVLCSSSKQGYGAVAMSRSGIVGASCGCVTETEAENQAKKSCNARGARKISIVATFDTFNNENAQDSKFAAVVCGEGGHYGYSVTDDSKEEAIKLASQVCLAAGAQNIEVLCSTSKGGYGAVAKSGIVFGASCGCETTADAEQRAIIDCKRRGGQKIKIVDTFECTL